MRHFMTSVLLAALITTTVYAAAPAKIKASKKITKPAVIRCAVTGEKIASLPAPGGKSVYKGKTYYFCCSGCKPQFDKNPEKYIKTASKSVSR